MKRPARLTEVFAEGVEIAGKYGDGHGSYGLALFVKPAARGGVRKTWIQRLTINGKRRELGLGSYPLFTLIDARAAALDNARRARANQASNIDKFLASAPTPEPLALPAPTLTPLALPAPTPEPQDTITFGQAYEHNILLRLPRWKMNARGKRSSETLWRGVYAKYLADTIGDTPISEITSRTLQPIFEPLWNEKPSVAKHVSTFAFNVFEWAIGMEYVISNPVLKAQRALGKVSTADKTHYRSVPIEEAPNAYALIANDTGYDIAKNAMRFLILTAARKEEVLGAKWGEIDFKAKTWTIEGGKGGRMKKRATHIVPLSEAALGVLRDCIKDTLKADAYIFATQRRRGEYGAAMMSGASLPNLCDRVGMNGTPHGWRATFLTWVEENTDYGLAVGKAALAHVQGNVTTQAYNRATYFDKRRELMGAWAAYLC